MRSHDYVSDRTHDGRAHRMLVLIDVCTRKGPTIRVARWLRSPDALDCLSEPFGEHRIPGHLRRGNHGELRARGVRAWPARLGLRTPSVEPGSPWANSLNERFNGSLRNELPNGELPCTLKEAQVLIERWR